MSDDFGLINDKERLFVGSYTDKVIKQERKRILALLSDDAEIWHSENLQKDLIAIIKGKNK